MIYSETLSVSIMSDIIFHYCRRQLHQSVKYYEVLMVCPSRKRQTASYIDQISGRGRSVEFWGVRLTLAQNGENRENRKICWKVIERNIVLVKLHSLYFIYQVIEFFSEHKANECVCVLCRVWSIGTFFPLDAYEWRLHYSILQRVKH